MTTKVKTASRILESVHETAMDLYRLSFIDKRKMCNYEQVIAPSLASGRGQSTSDKWVRDREKGSE